MRRGTFHLYDNKCRKSTRTSRSTYTPAHSGPWDCTPRKPFARRGSARCQACWDCSHPIRSWTQAFPLAAAETQGWSRTPPAFELHPDACSECTTPFSRNVEFLAPQVINSAGAWSPFIKPEQRILVQDVTRLPSESASLKAYKEQKVQEHTSLNPVGIANMSYNIQVKKMQHARHLL